METTMTTRRQSEIPGFERQVENEHVERAAAAYCTIRDERAAQSKKEKQAQLELEATMRAHGYDRYEYTDDYGEVLVARIVVGSSKAVVEKTGEADSEIGDGLDSTDSLVAQSRKAQLDAGVAESEDGDVVVPDSSVPRTKKKRGPKPKAVAPAP
jgi:hypothetical protein